MVILSHLFQDTENGGIECFRLDKLKLVIGYISHEKPRLCLICLYLYLHTSCMVTTTVFDTSVGTNVLIG